MDAPTGAVSHFIPSGEPAVTAFVLDSCTGILTTRDQKQGTRLPCQQSDNACYRESPPASGRKIPARGSVSLECPFLQAFPLRHEAQREHHFRDGALANVVPPTPSIQD